MRPDEDVLRSNSGCEETTASQSKLIVYLAVLAAYVSNRIVDSFLPDLIRSIGVDETQVGYCVGAMHLVFYATQAFTFNWMRNSQPVLALGMIGLFLAMCGIAFSHLYLWLILFRGLHGIASAHAETVTWSVKASEINVMRSFAVISGPLIAGLLSKPEEYLLSYFGDWELLKMYPYFLPCSIPATLSALACLMSLWTSTESSAPRIHVSSIHNSPTVQNADEIPYDCDLTLVIGPIACLTFLEIIVSAVQPTFYSTAIGLGGTGFALPAIGAVLSCCALINVLLQVFAKTICSRYSPRGISITGFLLAPVAVLFFPLINSFARIEGLGVTMWLCIALQALILAAVKFASGSTMIYLHPDARAREHINRTAIVVMSCMRCAGSFATNALFSLATNEERYYGGRCIDLRLVFVCGALCVAFLLPAQSVRLGPTLLPMPNAMGSRA